MSSVLKTSTSESFKIKIRSMRIVLFIGFLLMLGKFAAFFLTHSVAVFSDALESIINITAGAFALYSLLFASKPRDSDHPYGHGKIENLSAGFEGGLIFLAGIAILVKSVTAFFYPHELEHLEIGIVISVLAGTVNCFSGFYLIRQGKKYNSFILIADGKHLLTDAVSSVGLVLGLVLIYYTGKVYLDSILGILFGFIILRTGYKLVYESITNLLDKADLEKLNQLVKVLNEYRQPQWIDIHDLRILKYGSHLHIDCHVTLPWYNTLEQSHLEVHSIEAMIKEQFGSEVELFIHADPCPPSSCGICSMTNCSHRKFPLVKKLEWNLTNLLPNSKHQTG